MTKNNDDTKAAATSYPAGEDIYNNLKEEQDIDPENIAANKSPNSTDALNNDAAPGKDLDIPGSELDDAEEMIGSEDEENNYYSISGDNHLELEESQGE